MHFLWNQSATQVHTTNSKNQKTLHSYTQNKSFTSHSHASHLHHLYIVLIEVNEFHCWN